MTISAVMRMRDMVHGIIMMLMMTVMKMTLMHVIGVSERTL